MSAGDLLTPGRLRDLFNSSLPASHSRRARAHVQDAKHTSLHVCTHPHTHRAGVSGEGEKKKTQLPHRRTIRRQQSGVSWREADTLTFQQPGSLDGSGPHTHARRRTQTHTHTMPYDDMRFNIIWAALRSCSQTANQMKTLVTQKV